MAYILAHTDEEITADGQIVNCRLDLVLANDITGPLAIKGFKAMGATKVFDKDKVALVMDHFTPQKDIASANQVMISRKFAAEQDITHYYEGGNCGARRAARSGALASQPTIPRRIGVASIEVAKNWCGTAVSSGR